MLLIRRREGDGFDVVVPPSASETRVHVRVLDVFTNDRGKLESKVGVVAPDAVRIVRHEVASHPDEIDLTPLKPHDREYVRSWLSGD